MSLLRVIALSLGLFIALGSMLPSAYAGIRGEVEKIARLNPDLGRDRLRIADLIFKFSVYLQIASVSQESYTFGFTREEPNQRRSFYFDLFWSAFDEEIDFLELAFTEYDKQVDTLHILSTPLLKVYFKDGSVAAIANLAIEQEKLRLLRNLFTQDFIEIPFPFHGVDGLRSVSKRTLICREVEKTLNLLGSQPILPREDGQFEFIAQILPLVRTSKSAVASPDQAKDSQLGAPNLTELLNEKIMYSRAKIDLLTITADMRRIPPEAQDPELEAAILSYLQFFSL